MLDFRPTGALETYFRHCETHCVAGCCGLDAFDFSTGHAEAWVRAVGKGPVREAMAQIDDLFTRRDEWAEGMTSGQSDLNLRFDRNGTETFLMRINDLLKHAMQLKYSN
jgi:Family of unknown function (DUF6331)